MSPKFAFLRKGALGLLAAVSLAVAVAIACKPEPLHFYLSVLVGKESTKYAPQYREEAFTSIRIGDSLGDVLDRLGAPLTVAVFCRRDLAFRSNESHIQDSRYIVSQINEVSCDEVASERIYLEYTGQSHAHGNYLVRSVSFDSSRVVVDIVRTYEWD